MIAMAILALSLVYLFKAEANSLRLAAKGRALNIATQLARKKLIDCKYDLIKKGFSIGDYESTGNFQEDGFEDYTWECHGLRFNMPPPSSEAISKAMASFNQQGVNPTNGGFEMASNVLAPFFGLISTTLGDSIRELVLIVHWKEQEVSEELRVVTHVVDTKPMADLASVLKVQMAPRSPPPPKKEPK